MTTNDVNLGSIIDKFLNNKVLFLINLLVFIVLGLMIGFFSRVEYKSQVVIKEQKTGNVRDITINEGLRELIKKYAGEFGVTNLGSFIFTNAGGNDPLSIQYVNRKLKGILNKHRIKVSNPSSHTLRKTFGLRVFEMNYKSDEALITLSQIFNHSNTAITRRYIGLQQEKIKNVYLSL